ncbi:hypothetical protein OROHE_021934 [Orobanche hederae]
MNKAYERIEWLFMELVLHRLGFEHSFIQLIMLCVRSVSYTLKLNWETFGPLQTQRGLHQGECLSPYLFLFCTETFSSLIVDAKSRGVVCGGFVSPTAPSVSHLLFGDVCDASRESAVEINDICIDI